MKNPTYITRGKKPYQQYLFRCWIPQDLKCIFDNQNEIRISLKNSQISQSRIISFDLYQLSQYIFQEMRQGNIRDITIDDVKRILRDKVEQTLKHIHHYHWDTNRFDEEEVQKRIAETLEKEQELKDHLKKDYKGTLSKIEKEIEEILKKENIIQDKKNVDYKGLIGRWTELRLLRESSKRELLSEEGKTI